MNIERTKDRVSIDAAELQKIIKEHVEKETGRKTYDLVEFVQLKIDHRMTQTTAWVRLENEDGAQNA